MYEIIYFDNKNASNQVFKKLISARNIAEATAKWNISTSKDAEIFNVAEMPVKIMESETLHLIIDGEMSDEMTHRELTEELLQLSTEAIVYDSENLRYHLTSDYLKSIMG